MSSTCHPIQNVDLLDVSRGSPYSSSLSDGTNASMLMEAWPALCWRPAHFWASDGLLSAMLSSAMLDFWAFARLPSHSWALARPPPDFFAGLSSASCMKLIGRPQAGYGSGKVFTGSFKSTVQSYFLAKTASRICKHAQQTQRCFGVRRNSQGKEVCAFGCRHGSLCTQKEPGFHI